jgi:hypothetical protein
MTNEERYTLQQMTCKVERERLKGISEMRVKSETEFLTDMLLLVSAPYEAESVYGNDSLSQMHGRLDKVRINATMRIAELARMKD